MNAHLEYQQKILEELQDISEEHFQELLKIIRDYKMSVFSANKQKKVISLYGIWKGKISNDIEEPLREIREDWKKRLENVNV
jgi:hypothetical protein